MAKAIALTFTGDRYAAKTFNHFDTAFIALDPFHNAEFEGEDSTSFDVPLVDVQTDIRNFYHVDS
jgi:hypothetical protein